MWGSQGGCDDWKDDVMYTHIIFMCDIHGEGRRWWKNFGGTCV